jgi:diguanylate cyclase (GGDEF)-like protein
MSTRVYNILDWLDIPVVVIREDMSILDFNNAFILLSGVGKAVIGMDIRDLILFRDIRLDFTEAILRNDRKRKIYIHHGDSVFELRVATRQGDEISGEKVFVVYLFDVTKYMNAEKELLRKNRELMIANSISNIFIVSSETEKVYDHILDKCMLVGDFSLGCIVMPSQNDEGLLVKTQKGLSLAFQRAINSGQLNSIIRSTEPPMRIIEREEIEKEDLFIKEGIIFSVIVPLVSGGNIHGYLILGNRKERIFDLELASIISLIGNNVSLVLDKIRLFKEMERLSITDPLTGLFNRRYFYDALEKEIERVKRYKSSFSIVLLDIDDFKRVNDEYGHLAGDRVLQILADILRRTLRKVDIIARYGGEEFILLLPNSEKEEAELIANRIREEVSKTVFECKSDKGVDVICPITISGGITTCPDDFIELDKLLGAADRAMYEAKSLGKNRIVLFHREQDIFKHGGKG